MTEAECNLLASPSLSSVVISTTPFIPLYIFITALVWTINPSRLSEELCGSITDIHAAKKVMLPEELFPNFKSGFEANWNANRPNVDFIYFLIGSVVYISSLLKEIRLDCRSSG